MQQEWFTAAELAALGLPGLPLTESAVIRLAKRESWRRPAAEWSAANPTGLWRQRPGRGGGVEYHYSLLPSRAQAKLALAARPAEPDEAGERRKAKRDFARDAAWAHFDSLPDKRKAKARDRLAILEAVAALVRGGVAKDIACKLIADKHGIGISTLYGWQTRTHGVDRADWLPSLVDHHAGRTVEAECDADAWEMIKSDYLRAERPTFEACYWRLQRAATAHGWSIPASRTLLRRIEKTLPPAVIVLAREGVDAVKKMYPAQERRRDVFHALEAVNADGHRWDVWVEWPDGEVARPCMTAIQDLYSGALLAWRVDRSENWTGFRLAIGDMVETYGIPEHIWLDNGRNFAAKWMTGGVANRYRFKVREEDPEGILVQLGVAVHWTTPYSGQSKPIERMFRDWCDTIARHPAFAGAWTGNSPVNKPENYRSKAIPLDRFLELLTSEIAAHNARGGRQTHTARGRSFDATFLESYERSPIRRATEEQRRLWLLGADGVQAATRDGALRLMGNRFWAEFLHLYAGKKLVVRFDPDSLHDGVHVYGLDSAYLGYAPCVEAVGFADVDAAREHGRQRRRWLRAQKDMLDAARRMQPADVAALLPVVEPAARPAAPVIKPDFRPTHDLRRRIDAAPVTPAEAERHTALVAAFRAPPPAPKVDERDARWSRALAIEAAIAAGDAVDTDAAWLRRYQETPEYRARARLRHDFAQATA